MIASTPVQCGVMSGLAIEKLKTLSEALAKLTKDDINISRSLKDSANRLSKLELNLVLLGQFKRGKSTLANCLLGKSILPSSTVPLTTVVTEIRFGEDDALSVVFKNGKNISQPLNKISEYVTEKKNPKNQKGVDRVVVFCRSDFLKNGIVLIDTPGTSSTFLHNTKVANDYLPNCDAAILLISADSPLSSEETNFIISIKKYASKIFFVVNKCDYFSKHEIKDILKHIETELSKIDVNADLIPLSARLGLKGKVEKNKKILENSGIKKLENTLMKFLSKKKRETLLDSTNLKLNSISNSLYNRLKSEYASVDMDAKSFQKKIAEFHDQFERVKQSVLMYSGSIDSEFSDIMADIDNSMEDAKGKLPKIIQGKIVKSLEMRDGKVKFVDRVNSLMKKHVEGELKIWWNELDRRIKERVKEMEKRYVNLVNDTNLELESISKDIFNFGIRPISCDCTINFRTIFYFQVSGFRQESMILPSLNTLLPSNMVKKRIFRELESKIEEEVDTNLGRIRYDYLQRLEKGKENFKESLFKQLEKTKKEIEIGLKKGKAFSDKTLEEKIKMKKLLDKQISIVSEIIKETGGL
jgi:small GTP-binding protein